MRRRRFVRRRRENFENVEINVSKPRTAFYRNKMSTTRCE
jgi:hypothetical protein